MAMDEKIENTIIDMVSNFLYYDRKEDEELPVGAIEEAVRSGALSVDEIVSRFRTELEKSVEYN
jgi:hypothetical protein